jgi:Asp-tRNA(Asn)/Glu-tRNA(Gln) amidotransferase B subunit
MTVLQIHEETAFAVMYNDITAKAVSSWICNTVILAYKSSEITLPRNQVKAREVRAIASSWSIFNSASLTEILSEG